MVDSDEVDGGTVVGYDGEGRVVSIEVLGFSKKVFSLNELIVKGLAALVRA